jgi:hypothetical protein
MRIWLAGYHSTRRQLDLVRRERIRPLATETALFGVVGRASVGIGSPELLIRSSQSFPAACHRE